MGLDLHSEAELIASVLAGDDRRAFAELVARHQGKVRSLLRRLTYGDNGMADDLAQETFLRVYRFLHSYSGQSSLSTWIYRIAYNTFRNERDRRHATSGHLDARDVSVVDSAESPHPSELRMDLHRAMRCLSEQEHTIISLTYGLGCSHEEIADILSMPIGTVKTHILRGKTKLKQKLSAWNAKGEP